MTKRFLKSIQDYRRRKAERLSEVIRKICGKRIKGGRYIISVGMK